MPPRRHEGNALSFRVVMTGDGRRQSGNSGTNVACCNALPRYAGDGGQCAEKVISSSVSSVARRMPEAFSSRWSSCSTISFAASTSMMDVGLSPSFFASITSSSCVSLRGARGHGTVAHPVSATAKSNAAERRIEVLLRSLGIMAGITAHVHGRDRPRTGALHQSLIGHFETVEARWNSAYIVYSRIWRLRIGPSNSFMRARNCHTRHDESNIPPRERTTPVAGSVRIQRFL